MRVFPAWGLEDGHLFDVVDLGLIDADWVANNKDPIHDSSFLRFMEENGVRYDDFYWAAKTINPSPEDREKYKLSPAGPAGGGLAARLTVYVPKSAEGLREKVEEKWGDKFSTTA